MKGREGVEAKGVLPLLLPIIAAVNLTQDEESNQLIQVISNWQVATGTWVTGLFVDYHQVSQLRKRSCSFEVVFQVHNLLFNCWFPHLHMTFPIITSLAEEEGYNQGRQKYISAVQSNPTAPFGGTTAVILAHLTRVVAKTLIFTSLLFLFLTFSP